MSGARPPRQSPRQTLDAPANARTVIVARAAYRHRRMIDAAALFPVSGAILLMLPLLWVGAGGGAARTSHVLIYVFAVWAVLVILSAAITHSLGTGADTRLSDAEGEPGTDDAPND